MLTVILVIIFVLAVLIMVHELGHFMAAKIMGVKIEKVSLGFGRKLLSKTVGDTEYRISLVPLGGYVKMAGERLDEEKPAQKWEFFGQAVWRRAVILLAGPFMNFVLAWVIFSSILYLGAPVVKAVIGEVKPGEPAAAAGLNAGDKVLSVDNEPVGNWGEMASVIFHNPGRRLNLKVERGGEIIKLAVTPRVSEELNPLNEKVTKGFIGVSPDPSQLYYFKETLPQALLKGTRQTITITRMIYAGIWKMATGQISPRHLGGPILIAQLTAQQVKFGFGPLMTFLALISVNLAVINLLPIPILDGGHLLFLVAEKIKRRPVSLKTQEIAQSIGLFVLIGIMLLATYNDIQRTRLQRAVEKREKSILNGRKSADIPD
ncbi:MAG: RIP metalloprotease RseP [Candidatus Ratteibacteria bacterium]|nr:RIP metalloprotease RseP [Candidatus Ratteibacteria bacterium]